MKPEQVIESSRRPGLKGRGGAGFPAGMKWQFVVKDTPKPKYIVCNADESEPGTFKDHLLMERNPHLLFEGCMIAWHAIGAKVAYIYIRGEFFHVQQVLEQQLEEAYKQRLRGRNVMGLGFDFDIHIHRGAGAYEAGEETALLESLEGKRAQPRLKPPFPASAGLYGSPTAVNNVETLCNVPSILRHGAEWYAALGPEKNGGPKLYCVSGHVQRPGVYRSVDENDAARADFRARGRHSRRPGVEGGDSRADRPFRFCCPISWTSRRASTAWPKPDRCSVRRASSCSTTPRAWSGSRRTCCASTATSRVASARPAAKARSGW